MRQALRRFFNEWMSKDTPYLMWLLSPFTAFRKADDVATADDELLIGRERHSFMDIESENVEPAVQREIARLVNELQGVFSAQSIEGLARDSLGQLSHATVRRYLPQLVYRFTRERLKALVRVQHISTRGELDVLFVCGRNAARSQMAAALMHQLGGGRVSVHSAGAAPAEQVDPDVVAVMAEVGLDLTEAFPKPLTDEVVRAADVVITLGCGDVCPLLPYKTYQDWPIDDPQGEPLDRVRQIRDEITVRVQGLAAILEAPMAR